MRAQGSFAGLLATLLLAMSSWSSACDLSCSLASRHLGCETSQTAQAQPPAEDAAAKMDMEHCLHATPPASGEQLAAAPTVTAVPCLHEACRQAAVSTAAKHSGQGTRQNAARWAMLVITDAAPPSAFFRSMERDNLPPKIPPLDLLSASLRI
jgi:hypothetical protein